VDLFYQLVLKTFSNFGFIHLSSPASISDLILIALEDVWKPKMKPKDHIATVN